REVTNMRTIPMVSLRMVRERGIPYGRRQLQSSHCAYRLSSGLLEDRDREHMWLVCRDTKNYVTCLAEVSVGCLNSAIVHPREVFKTAILANAASVLLVHNHPSGNVEPSAEDQSLTQRLREAGRILGIHLVDHILIGDGKYYSFADADGLK